MSSKCSAAATHIPRIRAGAELLKPTATKAVLQVAARLHLRRGGRLLVAAEHHLRPRQQREHLCGFELQRCWFHGPIPSCDGSRLTLPEPCALRDFFGRPSPTSAADGAATPT